MKDFKFLLFPLISVLCACGSSNDVVSEKWIQKRKFRKGAHFNIRSVQSNQIAVVYPAKTGKEKKEQSFRAPFIGLKQIKSNRETTLLASPIRSLVQNSQSGTMFRTKDSSSSIDLQEDLKSPPIKEDTSQLLETQQLLEESKKAALRAWGALAIGIVTIPLFIGIPLLIYSRVQATRSLVLYKEATGKTKWSMLGNMLLTLGFINMMVALRVGKLKRKARLSVQENALFDGKSAPKEKVISSASIYSLITSILAIPSAGAMGILSGITGLFAFYEYRKAPDTSKSAQLNFARLGIGFSLATTSVWTLIFILVGLEFSFLLLAAAFPLALFIGTLLTLIWIKRKYPLE